MVSDHMARRMSGVSRTLITPELTKVIRSYSDLRVNFVTSGSEVTTFSKGHPFMLPIYLVNQPGPRVSTRSLARKSGAAA